MALVYSRSERPCMAHLKDERTPRSGPLNEDVFAMAPCAEEKAPQPGVQELAEQIHRLLLQVGAALPQARGAPCPGAHALQHAPMLPCPVPALLLRWPCHCLNVPKEPAWTLSLSSQIHGFSWPCIWCHMQARSPSEPLKAPCAGSSVPPGPRRPHMTSHSIGLFQPRVLGSGTGGLGDMTLQKNQCNYSQPHH